MRPALGFAAGAEALRKMGEAIVLVAPTGGGEGGTAPLFDDSRTDELVGPIFVREGVQSWNVVDEDGPLPFDADVILSNYTWSYPIANKADELYSKALLDPLLLRMGAQSKRGQNGQSTPPRRRSSRTPPSPRKSSSANGSAGPQSVASR
jgi:hypothetical protein